MPITNALENAKRLEGLGFTHEQAQGLSEMLEQTALVSQPDLGDLATKADIAAIRKDLREFATKAEVQALASELRMEMQMMESRILRELRTQMFWFFSMLLGLLGLSIAILKFLP